MERAQRHNTQTKAINLRREFSAQRLVGAPVLQSLLRLSSLLSPASYRRSLGREEKAIAAVRIKGFDGSRELRGQSPLLTALGSSRRARADSASIRIAT